MVDKKDESVNDNDSILQLINRFKASCMANELKILEETGLSPAEYKGISALEPGEVVNGGEVSAKMNLSLSRASRVIEKMVQNGYLIRENDRVDRRKCTISLADKGVELKKQINSVHSECERRIKSQLNQSEIHTFGTTLKKIMNLI